jgi:hypothetical protein
MPESRPRQREILIETYRKGKIAEAFRAFKEIYLEIADQLIDHLKGEETSSPGTKEASFLDSRLRYQRNSIGSPEPK